MKEVLEVPIEQIQVGEHDVRLPENDIEIAELTASIRKFGVLVPLIARRLDDKYVLIAGHRRLQAARMAGLETVSVIVRTGSLAEETEVSFAENFFRRDLSPVELACAIKQCLDTKVMGIEELARGFHRSEHWVREMAAITDWPGDVLEAMHNEKLSISAAANLACVTDDVYREFLVRNAVESGATARTTSAWLQAWRSMLTPEDAIKKEPVAGQTSAAPMVPQAPCLCCGEIFPVDKMSHVPMCGACIQTIRSAGMTAG
ncbi:MAG: ParB/RepB/Spo0J family partition protein [Sedimentisphaerales bacterium]